MARTVPAAVDSDLSGSKPLPIWCLEVDYPGGTVYLTSREHAVVFGANTFSSKPVEVGEIRLEHGSDGTSQLSIGDADAFWNTILTTGVDLRGREVRLRYTVEAATGAGSSASDAVIDTRLVDGIERSQGLLTIRLVGLLGALARRDLPKGRITRELAPGIPPAGSFF